MPMSTPPSWAKSLYNTFPLSTLPQEDVSQVRASSLPVLWISPPTSGRSWTSSDPECLRAQLLLAFRGVKFISRSWTNTKAAPGATLPALHLPSELLSSPEIRPWVDSHYPASQLQGLPSSAAHDEGLAIAQLVLNRLQPYLSASPSLPKPAVLAAGLTTPLPASLTGDDRSVDAEALEHDAREAWDALEALVGEGFLLGAEQPTDLDALVAAYAYAAAARLGSRPAVESYVDRVLDRAEKMVNI